MIIEIYHFSSPNFHRVPLRLHELRYYFHVCVCTRPILQFFFLGFNSLFLLFYFMCISFLFLFKLISPKYISRIFSASCSLSLRRQNPRATINAFIHLYVSRVSRRECKVIAITRSKRDFGIFTRDQVVTSRTNVASSRARACGQESA